MNPTANSLNACFSAGSQLPAVRSEIHIRRDVIDSALEGFHAHVTEIQERQKEALNALTDLLSRIIAALVERGLTCQCSAVIASILENLGKRSPAGYSSISHSFHARTQKRNILTNASLPRWLSEELPRTLEEAKELLSDYFEELLDCVQEIGKSLRFGSICSQCLESVHGRVSARLGSRTEI